MSKDVSEQNNKLLKSLNSVIEDDESQLDLINSLINEYQLNIHFGDLIIRKFIAYSNNDFETFKIYAEKLYHSFQQVQKECDVPLSLVNQFEFHQRLERTFMNVILKMKKGKVNNFSSYLYISFLNTFRNIADQIQKNQNEEVDLLINYTKDNK